MSFDDLIRPELGKITGPKGGWTNQQTAYIPTFFIAPPDLRMGQYWYIKHPGASALCEVEVMEVTEKTVVLKDTRSKFSENMRYEKTDIKFVEKVI